MRKLRTPAAWLCCLVLLYSSLGSGVLWHVHRQALRRVVKTRLKAEVPATELTTFVFTADELADVRVERHEIRYRGHMYDIVRETPLGSRVEVACIADEEEDRLFAQLPTLIGQAHHTTNRAERAVLLAFGQWSYLPVAPFLLGCVPQERATDAAYRPMDWSWATGAVPTPPPERALLS